MTGWYCAVWLAMTRHPHQLDAPLILMTYGGIYNVWLYCCNQVFVERLPIRYDLENKNAILKPVVFLDNSGLDAPDSGYLLKDKEKAPVRLPTKDASSTGKTVLS